MSEPSADALLAGLGALVGRHGVTFRMWAPHAEQVWVKGDFIGWDDSRAHGK